MSTEEDVSRQEIRRELAQFLRTKRERLTPQEAGVVTTRHRRTPGLRREEVAYLADISTKWYERLEAADDVHPSTATLLGIARALQLSVADTQYMFDLVGLAIPRTERFDEPIPEVLDTYVPSIKGAGAFLADRILTPLRWNAIADATHQCARFADPLDRNLLVRGVENEDIARFLGEDYDTLARRGVGMFRRHYLSHRRTEFVERVYERLKEAPVFQKYWKDLAVEEEITGDRPFRRHHPTAGALMIVPMDLYLHRREDLVLRLLFPADDETAKKFEQLEKIGTPWNPSFG